MEFANPLKTLPNRVLSLASNLEALILLRWLAVGGVMIALVAADIIGLPLPFFSHFVLLLLLSTLNGGYWFWLRAYKCKCQKTGDKDNEKICSGDKIPRVLFLQLFSQIVTDWILLTAFLHFSGGILNPFLMVYVLHIIIGVSLIDVNMTALLAGFGTLCISITTHLEVIGILDYHPLYIGAPDVRFLPWYIVFGLLFALLLVLFITGTITYSLIQGIRERERKLLKMSHDLVELSRVKSEFLFRVTHELKSPIVAIISGIDAILISVGETLKGVPLEMLKRMKGRGKGLIELIKDLLEIAHLSTPDYDKHFEPVEPEELLKEVCDTQSIIASEKNIKFEVEISSPPVINANRDALREVFSNLVSNAVRYTPHGGVVRVLLTAENSDLFFRVADTGIGISEEDKEKLFNEFFRARNAVKFSAVGTGLGLAITKAHIESFGGSISVESKLNEGTAFVVNIPAFQGDEGNE